MALILDGLKIRKEIESELAKEIKIFPHKPILAIIQVGNLPESNAYIEQKKKFAVRIGAEVRHIKVEENFDTALLKQKIHELNQDKDVNGIIIQLPLVSGKDATLFIEEIDSCKDVDGLTKTSVKNLYLNRDGFVPATASGTINLLDYYQIPIEGKRVVVIGRSALVGKATALSLLNRNATVTICHKKTVDLEEITRQAEIIVVATGVPKLITSKHVSKDQTIVDVGINLLMDKTLLKPEQEMLGRTFVGDVDFEEVKNIVSAISPVPGGVGPMTVAHLFKNLIRAYKSQNNLKS